jgi:LEA14-like dessication related protein
MKIQKKHLVAGSIALVTITGAFVYMQYKKLMEYTLGFKSMKVKKVSLNEIVLDVFLLFNNPSKLKFDITEQEYKVFINNQFVSDAVNYSTNKIEPKSSSVLGVNIKFNPSTVLKVLKLNWTDILLNPAQSKIKIEMKFKVKLYLIPITIPYVYELTFQELVGLTKS